MKRVLFVDDDSRVLDGLERMLHPWRDRWELRFVRGGRNALAALRTAPADLVISNLWMPEMSGAELLENVRREWPASGRVMLSGSSDRESSSDAVDVAQLWLCKPCGADALRTAIETLLED